MGIGRVRVGRFTVPLWSLVVVVVGLVVAGAVVARTTSYKTIAWKREAHPQTAWVACNRNARTGRPSTFTPLTDRAAASLVTPEAETRADNDKAYTIGGRTYPGTNEYVPSAAQIRAFRSAKTSSGQPVLKFNPYFADVDGRDGMHDPTTDELIQWSSHKWGIPEDWLRAEYVRESYWSMFQLGDRFTLSPSMAARYPVQAHAGGTSVYESLGITQVKWIPDGSVGAGTEPLRWESTAFNLDDQAATIRFYYDDPGGSRTSWGDASYVPCQQWRSIGGWFRPYPWGNADQAGYISAVQQNLSARAWRSGSFLSWTPPSTWPGLRFR